MTDSREEEFAAKLLETFKIEAREHLQALNQGLLQLEHTSPGTETKENVDTIFREAHSLKGAARAVAFNEIERICQSLENVLSGWREKTLAIQPTQFDTLYQTLDVIDQGITNPAPANLSQLLPKIEAMVEKLNDLKNTPPSPASPYQTKTSEKFLEHVEEQITKTEDATKNKEIPSLDTAKITQAPTQAAPTIRISSQKLDKLLQRVEETLIIKLSAEQQFKNLKGLGLLIDESTKKWSDVLPLLKIIKNYISKTHPPGEILVYLDKLQHYLDWRATFNKTLHEEFNTVTSFSAQDLRLSVGMIDNLLEETKKVLMQPFSTVLESFPRMVRDLAHSLGKDVNLVVEGGDIEIDRRILEELKDPLIHLVRNCIDHGIESPETRKKNQKTPEGTILISANQTSGNQVELLIRDDGIGLNVEKIREAALKKNIVTAAELEKLNAQEILKLIFRTGFSTSEIITELSGRGLGMGIVAEKIEKLGGTIILDSSPGKGTTFRLILPLTLATFRGIHVRVMDQDYIIPTHHVKKVGRLIPEDIHAVEDRQMITIENEAVPLYSLANLLKIPSKKEYSQIPLRFYLVLKTSEGTMATGVHQILGEQEVFVKSLGKQLDRLKKITSATILEKGNVVPILDPFDLVKSSMQTESSEPGSQANDKSSQTSQQVILVAEDSITARTLLKNILEASGFKVKTAVDGAEAFSMLKTEHADLLLSDVEMPRMNGFELTAKVRENEKLKDLPVVLCTSRGSKEDREHGIEVGANAYIDKSSFAQSNLLDIIKRLL